MAETATAIVHPGMRIRRFGSVRRKLLAARKSIPAELYEAAAIDGASAWQQFTKVTLPFLAPTIAITVMPIVTFVLLLAAAFADIGQTAFLVLDAFIGLFLIGGHFGMHSICGIFYPSVYRGNGAGWATSVAKIGSITGPLVGGWILATALPVRNIFVVLAICPAIFAVCIFAVGRIHSRMLGREALLEEAAQLSVKHA